MLVKTSLDLVLASASPRRAELLDQIGVVPNLIVPPNIDETVITGESPRHLVSRLSVNKAIWVSERHSGSVILAADTIVACGRRILSKAETPEQALSFLKLLSGRRHRVVSGLTIVSPQGNVHERIVETHVLFKSLSLRELDLYLASGEWQDKAGAYGIQGLAAKFVKNKASSTAVFPPPITATSLSLKKNPSQVAHAEIPKPLNLFSLSILSHLA